MKKVLIFILLLVSGVLLWYSSLAYLANNLGIANLYITADSAIGITGSLFLALTLSAMSYAIILLSLQVKSNQTKFEKSLLTNNIHLEIIALSSLINECDTTLHRYDRWEEAGIKGDYMNAKTSVRDKMNNYREKLEKSYEDIQQLTLDDMS